MAMAMPHELDDDGGRSRGDFSSRPILAHVAENIYIANLLGARAALAAFPGAGRVLNLCHEPIDDARADNAHAIEDSAAMTPAAAALFVGAASRRIEELLRGADEEACDWVVVNCLAGVNRSSAAVLAWLVCCQARMPFGQALRLLKSTKAAQAKRVRFKNRYQSFGAGGPTEHLFSWPTLYGRSAKTLLAAVKAAGRDLPAARKRKRAA